MALAERSGELLSGLPHGWRRARFELTAEDHADAERVAVILGPATPGRSGDRFVLNVYDGPERLGTSPDLLRRVLGRLDQEGIRGRLRVVESEGSEPVAPTPVEYQGTAVHPPAEPTSKLGASWSALVDTLPPDWSHLYAEVELDSSDYLERAALLMAPANPLRPEEAGPTHLRFRASRVVGYGVAAGMAHRCLERLDTEGITGSLRVLRVVSEDRPVATQGPVWRIGGKSL